MPVFEIESGGRVFEVEAPSAEAAAGAVSAATPKPAGVAKNIGAGLAEGVINFGTMIPNMREGAISAAAAGTRMMGIDVPQERVDQVKNVARYLPMIGGPTGEEVKSAVEGYTGEFPKAQTTVEKFARTASEFAPGALVGPQGAARGVIQHGGALLRKLLQYGVAPGAASEYAGQRAEGTPYEGLARIAGTLLGSAGGAIGGAAYSAGKNRFAAGQTAGSLANVLGQPVRAGAVRRVAESAVADDITPQSVAARQAELGPDAMVLDMGRQLRGRAEAVAAQPGRGQNTVLDAVEGRTGRFGEGTAQRVAQTLDTEMGPTHNVVELVDRVNATVDRIARPLYREVMDAHPIVQVPAALTERPAIAQAMKNAVTLARQHGENIAGTTERRTVLSGPGYNIGEDITHPAQTSLRYWDYVKKDLDRRINSYMKSGGTSELNSADKADLAGLMDARGALVRHLDDTTRGAYREARQAAATKYELREALDFGRSAFNSRLLPEEFVAELSEMSVPQRAMAQAGFRRELDRIVEATRNEGATARRILDTNHVLQKAEALFGPQAVREIERRVGAENVFQETTQDIARNSRTAVRQQLIKDTSTPSTSEIQSASLPGLAWAAGRGGLNYLRDQGMQGTRSSIADILTASGPQIDPAMNAILRYANTRARNSAQVGSRSSALINALIAGQ
jgi:hypothetical protein